MRRSATPEITAVSDTWYVDPIPPYVDWEGRRWTWDGVALDPEPPRDPLYDLDAWRAETERQLSGLLPEGFTAHFDDRALGRWPADRAPETVVRSP